MLSKTLITHERNTYMVQKLYFCQGVTFPVLHKAMFDDPSFLFESEPGWSSSFTNFASILNSLFGTVKG